MTLVGFAQIIKAPAIVTYNKSYIDLMLTNSYKHILVRYSRYCSTRPQANTLHAENYTQKD